MTLSFVSGKGDNAAMREARGELERALVERDGAGCFYCGHHATTVDHVVSRAAGGLDDIGNLVLACTSCNWLKSSAPVWFFVFKQHLGVAA